MKNLKAKLLASVAMLLVSTIMLTSASFAWFTISTAPEIKGIETTVVTNETLEIALDDEYKDAAAVDTASTFNAEATNPSLSGNAYTWGNQVDLGSGTAQTKFAAVDKTLRPATLATVDGKLAFRAPTYGNDGRITSIGTALSANVSDFDTGVKNAATDGFGVLKDASGLVYGYYIDYWMRSNVGGNVVLTTATDRDGSGDTETTNATVGGGSTFNAESKETTNTTIQAAYTALAKGISVAFQDVTPDANGVRPTNGTITKAKTVWGGTDKPYEATFVMRTATVDEIDEDEYVTTLTANAAKLIRVYVYLEGKDVLNAHASIDDQLIKGTLNLQFKIADVNTSMLTSQTTVQTNNQNQGGNTSGGDTPANPAT